MKKRIALLSNADRNSGVGSRAYQIASHIEEQDDFSLIPVMLDGRNTVMEIDGKETKHIVPLPSIFGSKSVSWVRLARHLPKFDLYDISNQTLSFIAKKRHPSIVTVHDIIELTDPQDARASLLNRYLMSGITSADRVVTVSEYTKRAVHEYFHIPESAITVIPNGVADEYKVLPGFSSSIAYQELLQDFRITNRHPIIMSVGSEHPRKNMATILKVIAALKSKHPNILLLKIGEPGILEGRRKTLEMIDTLGLQKNVQLVGSISSERINELYNIADVLLFPSKAEGFGMPPLEAMAAGCPVVCSNATSLPEVVGDAALMHVPSDIEAFVSSISHIISNQAFREALIEKGLARAQEFSWEAAGRAMLGVYRTLL